MGNLRNLLVFCFVEKDGFKRSLCLLFLLSDLWERMYYIYFEVSGKEGIFEKGKEVDDKM